MWQRPGGMETLGRVAKLLGLALSVIGGLILTIGVYSAYYCYANSPPNCGTGLISGILNSEIAGKVILILGLGAIALGAAMKMRYALGWNPNRSADELKFVIADRWVNTIIFSVALILLVWVALSVVTPSFTTTANATGFFLLR
jgi:hypothetical protein